MTDDKKIRQLEQQLSECDKIPDVDTHLKINIMNDLAWAMSDTDPAQAQSLAEKAHTLATSIENIAESYQLGIAYSLRTQGYLNMRVGEYPLGLTQLLEAQEIFESLDHINGLPDVYDGIAGIYYQISNFPESLNYMYKQLEAAQRLGDKRLIANAYNNLANVYFETADYERAVDTLQKNLKHAVEIGYRRIESLSYLNLAETFLLAGDYKKALENGLNGLHVSQEAGFELFEVYALDLIGKSNLKLGNPEEAVHYLGDALVSSRNLESKVTESLILLNLGQAYDDMQQFDRARDYLLQSIKTAQSIESRGELYKAHLLLSEIYEKQEDFAQALYHFRRHYEFKELVYNEKADERLKVLQVVHDTETAKKETEIFQLKTKQLEQEITERRKVEEVLQEARDKLEEQVKIRTSELSDTIALLNAEIRERERVEVEIQQMVEMLEQRVANRTKELATFFDLAMLASESLDLNEVLYPAISRIAIVSRCSIALIHLFDDGGVSLQLTAQYGFQDDDIHKLEEIRLYDSIRNWLSSFKESIVESNQFDTTKMPDVLRLPGRHYLGAQIRARGQPLGLLSCYRDSNHAFTLEDISLLTALAEQLGVVIENYRLRQRSEEMVLIKERHRLARELHDSITQSLYSQTLFARVGRYAYEDGDTEKLNNSMEQLEESSLIALKEMRMLLFQLESPLLEDGGLETAINNRLDMVERRLDIEVVYHIDNDISYPPLVDEALYRITLEALNNSLKHANTSQVSVRIVAEMGQVILEVADNGKGFKINRDHKGMGLQSMRERASIAGGNLEIITRPSKGTIVRALFGDRQDMPPN